MPINITMPALSPTMEEGNLSKWLVKEGDKVSPGDVIAEIETDKATMEVEAVDEGTVARIVVPAGTEGVKVNAVIAVLAGEGEDAAAAAKAGGEAAPVKAEAKPVADASKATPAKQDAASTKPAAASVQTEVAAADGATAPGSERVFASPLARRIAREAGVDVSAIKGTGPHGRVVKADVETAVSGGGAKAGAFAGVAAEAPAAPAPVSAPGPKALSDEAVLKLFEEGSYELVPHDNMRKTIARRLVEAKSTIPHFYLTLDCELDALLALRKQLNDAAPVRKTEKGEVAAYKLSVNDLVIKATAATLRRFPSCNATWTEDAILQYHDVDISVAVSIPEGLITPIVRRADQKGLAAISNEMKDLAARAKSGKLKPEEFQGGGFSISNMGMYGVSDFSAIINPPQAGILAVSAGLQKPVVKDGALAIATVMTCTLSVDHRVIDGALAAEFMQALKRTIEDPLSLLL